MEYIQTDFTKELSDLFVKYKKWLDSDKHVIHILDDENGINFMIRKQILVSEDSRDTLIQLITS